MAPSAIVNQVSSQLLMAQAAQKLLEAVREHGATPSPFAVALLDLMDQSTKLQEFEEMLTMAQQEATSDEAKTWQQVSLMSLTYCRKGLVEQQQRSLEKVCKLAQQGVSLFQSEEAPRTLSVEATEKLSAPKVAASERQPPNGPPPPPPGIPSPHEDSVEEKKLPRTPPGVWVVGPPPGLAPPPGLEAAVPPDSQSKTNWVKKDAPWRKAAAKKEAEKAASPVAQPATPAPQMMEQFALNFDAYSDED